MSYEEIITRTLPDALDTWTDQTRWYSEFVQELKDSLIATTVDRNYWQTNCTNSRTNHHKDIKLISDALIAEADSRGWCDDYDKFVGGLNGRLVVSLEEREHEYEVSATFLLKVSTTIKARNIDDANDQAADLDLGDYNCSVRGDYDDIEYQDHDIEEA
jgi:hypothetical protein